jgi:Transcription factor WhiB
MTALGFPAHRHRQVELLSDWRERARCRGLDIDLFFPGENKKKLSDAAKRQLSKAVGYCIECPVRQECALARARTNSSGVWGGELHNTTSTTYGLNRHGDEGGYRAHVNRGEVPCDACRRGYNKINTDKKRKKREAMQPEEPEQQPLPSELVDWGATLAHVRDMLDRLYK